MAWVEVEGAGRVRVGKILCLARNYREHVQEVGGEVPETPVVFLKPASSVIHDGEAVLLPSISRDVQAEAELGVLIGRRAREVGEGKALGCVAAYLAFQDITARDLQKEARRTGQPWTLCKGFDTFAPVSRARAAARVPDPQDLEIRLTINGQIRQVSHTRDMVFPVPRIIAYVSAFLTLERGDIIATGTPAGTPQLHPGDLVETEIPGVGRMANPVMGRARAPGT